MKKSSILILIIICLVGCKKISDKVNITGEINGLGTDTIYLYGMDESYDQIDTIYAKDSKFSFTTKVDTVISAYLLFNNRTEYPIFFDKGNKITIKGDIANPNLLSIDGNIYNEEFSKFQKELGELGNPSAEILEQKEENARLYQALASLPEKQRNRIYAHFFLGMSKSEIAKAEGTHKSRITRSINAGLRSLEKFLKEIS